MKINTRTKALKNFRLQNLIFVALLIAVTVFTVADIISDSKDGLDLLHTMAEALIALFSFIGAIYLWRKAASLNEKILELKQIADRAETHRAVAQEEAKKWKADAMIALRGLSEAIDNQMSRWELSNAEKEVALLLLKGLSLKEIANVRGVSDKTARAQSLAVYSKSGLSGRAELSAFFLEDIMLPQDNAKNL
jgi:DNA-binding NarL/FixJ family response regulator